MLSLFKSNLYIGPTFGCFTTMSDETSQETESGLPMVLSARGMSTAQIRESLAAAGVELTEPAIPNISVGVSREQYESLEELVNPLSLQNIRREFSILYSGNDLKLDGRIAYQALTGSFLSEQDRKSVEAGEKAFQDFLNIFKKDLKDAHGRVVVFRTDSQLNGTLDLLSEFQKTLEESVASYSSDELVRRYSAIVEKQRKRAHPKNRVYYDALKCELAFMIEKFTVESMGLKLRRTKELAKVNGDLARANVSYIAAEDKSRPARSGRERIFDFERRAEEFYRSLLGCLTVIPEVKSKPVLAVRHEIPKSVVVPKPAEPELNPYQKLHVAVYGRTTNPLFNDNKYVGRTLRLFLDYVQQNSRLSDELVSGLSNVLDEFNIPSMYAKHPLTESETKCFFDRLTLDFIEKGRLPKRRDLRELYLAVQRNN